MLNAIETYLALRRATGFAMSTAECLLKSFAAFAAERGQIQQEHQAEFQRELLHHPRSRPRPPGA